MWDNGGAGWDTRAGTWKRVYDTGVGHSVTAIAVKGNVTYAGWCGPSGCNPLQSSTTGGGFVRGIATNAGSTWHELDMSQLPNRLVNAVTVDSANAAHVYAVFGGFSRRWIPNAGSATSSSRRTLARRGRTSAATCRTRRPTTS